MSFQNRVLNNIVISEITESHWLKLKNSFPSKLFGDWELVAWETYFECFGKIYQWGTQGWCGSNWKPYCRENFLCKAPFMKNFWRTLLSTGVQKPEDRKIKLLLGHFFNRESFSKVKNFFETFGIIYQWGTQDNKSN